MAPLAFSLHVLTPVIPVISIVRPAVFAVPCGRTAFLRVVSPVKAPTTQAVGVHRLIVAPLAQGGSHWSVVLLAVVFIVQLAVHRSKG